MGVLFLVLIAGGVLIVTEVALLALRTFLVNHSKWKSNFAPEAVKNPPKQAIGEPDLDEYARERDRILAEAEA
jgi:hypothetical protein